MSVRREESCTIHQFFKDKVLVHLLVRPKNYSRSEMEVSRLVDVVEGTII